MPPHNAPQPLILLAEDDDAVRRAVARLLQREGYRVLEAADAAQALEIDTADGPPDLLLSDIVMPRMSGVQLAAHLEERHPGLPVLFMSGYAPEADLQARLDKPRAGFIGKPFTAADLASAVRAALAS